MSQINQNSKDEFEKQNHKIIGELMRLQNEQFELIKELLESTLKEGTVGHQTCEQGADDDDEEVCCAATRYAANQNDESTCAEKTSRRSLNRWQKKRKGAILDDDTVEENEIHFEDDKDDDEEESEGRTYKELSQRHDDSEYDLDDSFINDDSDE
jgi:hypothetical protein